MTTYNVISADSHVIEPPNLWVDYIEPEFKDRAPHCVQENGYDVFKCDGGVELIQVGGLSAAGKPSDQLQGPGTYAKVNPGAWDPNPRLDEMTTDGVQAEVLYPSIALRMFAIADPRYQLACFRAYNAWMADYVNVHPDRFRGIGLIPIEDMEVAATEVRRCKEQGLSGVAISVNPSEDRTYDDPFFDPLWSAAQETGLPISLHILTDRKYRPDVGIDRLDSTVTQAIHIQHALVRMIFSGVMHRFPRLTVISAENDIGWAGYLLERMDYVFDRRQSQWLKEVPRDMLPSDLFRRSVHLTFMRDRSGVVARDMIGIDNIMWASDYPHTDSTWPNSQAMIEWLCEGIPAEDRHKIVMANAARMYAFS